MPCFLLLIVINFIISVFVSTFWLAGVCQWQADWLCDLRYQPLCCTAPKESTQNSALSHNKWYYGRDYKMRRMKCKSRPCKSNHASPTLTWHAHSWISGFFTGYCISLPCWFLLMSLTSALGHPGLSVQTPFFLSGLLTHVISHGPRDLNISRMLIPNFYPMYMYDIHTTAWWYPKLTCPELISFRIPTVWLCKCSSS